MCVRRSRLSVGPIKSHRWVTPYEWPGLTPWNDGCVCVCMCLCVFVGVLVRVEVCVWVYVFLLGCVTDGLCQSSQSGQPSCWLEAEAGKPNELIRPWKNEWYPSFPIFSANFYLFIPTSQPLFILDTNQFKHFGNRFFESFLLRWDKRGGVGWSIVYWGGSKPRHLPWGWILFSFSFCLFSTVNSFS